MAPLLLFSAAVLMNTSATDFALGPLWADGTAAAQPIARMQTAIADLLLGARAAAGGAALAITAGFQPDLTGKLWVQPPGAEGVGQGAWVDVAPMDADGYPGPGIVSALAQAADGSLLTVQTAHDFSWNVVAAVTPPPRNATGGAAPLRAPLPARPLFNLTAYMGTWKWSLTGPCAWDEGRGALYLVAGTPDRPDGAVFGFPVRAGEGAPAAAPLPGGGEMVAAGLALPPAAGPPAALLLVMNPPTQAGGSSVWAVPLPLGSGGGAPQQVLTWGDGLQAGTAVMGWRPAGDPLAPGALGVILRNATGTFYSLLRVVEGGGGAGGGAAPAVTVSEVARIAVPLPAGVSLLVAAVP